MVAIFLSLILFCKNLFAWNALGHKIIMQIALNNLTLTNQKFLQGIENRSNKPLKSLLEASAWMDHLRGARFSHISAMHYIDLPYYVDSTYKEHKIINKINIKNSLHQIINDIYMDHEHSNISNIPIKYRFLYHLIGDLHQPLHTIERFSKAYPYGDKGGNLFKINNFYPANQLHQYWDKGGGFLYYIKNPTEKKIKSIAQKIQYKYPCFSENLSQNITSDLDQWIKESNNLAKNIVYSKFDKLTVKEYQNLTVEVTQQQLSKAGCRLSNILKKLLR